MLNRLLSGDMPRSRPLAVILLAILVGLAVAPFLFPGVKALNVAAKVLIFVVLVASFDLLLGYTGIVSFAHTMFFGIGAYGVAIAAGRLGPTWSALALGIGCALLLSLLISKPMAKWSTGARVIDNPANSTELWLVNTVRQLSERAGMRAACPFLRPIRRQSVL